MSQEQITRLVDQFIEDLDKYIVWHGMMKMPFGAPDDVYKRQSLKMDARDLVKQSGPLLAEALAKNHKGECEDVFKMIFYIAEGGGPDNACAAWSDLRARLKRLAVGGGRELPPLNDTDRTIAQFIADQPGEIGDTIAHQCHVSPDHFRRVFNKKLAPRGYFNRDGYHPPQDL